MLLLQLLINGAVNAAVIALLAIGFGMVYRSMRFFHIAYGAIYVQTSYITLSLMNFLPVLLAVAGGLISAALAGTFMELIVYSPLRTRKASSAVLFVASLGIYVVAVNGVAILYGNEVRTFTNSFYPSITLGEIIITRMQIGQFISGCTLVAIFWALVRNNTFFKAIWALGETPELITVLGFPVRGMRFVVMGISSTFAGAAALLTSFDIGIDPHSGMQALLSGAVAVLVGGVDRFWGWVGGALILALLQALAVWQWSSRWLDLVTFSVLVLVLLFRPQGIFTFQKRREEQ